MPNHFEQLLNALHELDLVKILGPVEMGVWSYTKPGFRDADNQWHGPQPGYSVELSHKGEQKRVEVTYIDIIGSQLPGELSGVLRGKLEEVVEELRNEGA